MKSIEEKKEYSSRWYHANKHLPEVKDRRKKLLRYWREANLSKYLLQRARDRAKQLNIEFDISDEDIICPDVCPVLNVSFEFKTRYAASLDRIDPSKGYVKGNVQVMSRKANIMKQDASPEELRNFAQWALKTYPV